MSSPGKGLGTDGVNEMLFHRLWEKDELNLGPAITIPDSIIYKHGRPVCWYFTALDGKIKKKTKHNLDAEKIEEEFSKRAAGYDIVCYFIQTERSQGIISSTLDHANIAHAA